MNTKEKGDIAVAFAIQHFVSGGYEVCLPLGDKRSYDLVIEKNNTFQSVQIKYAGIYLSKNGGCYANLRVMGGNQSYGYAKKYDNDAFDMLFVYTARGDKYVLPWRDVTNRNLIYIEHDKYAKYLVSKSMQG